MYKVSINCWDSLCGDFMGGKEYFDTLEQAEVYYLEMVQDYKKDEVEIYLVDCEINQILNNYITTEND